MNPSVFRSHLKEIDKLYCSTRNNECFIHFRDSDGSVAIMGSSSGKMGMGGSLHSISGGSPSSGTTQCWI